MVAIGNPSAMNDINRIHTSNSGGGSGGGDGGFAGGFVRPSPQQQKNSLNTTKTSSNGDNLQGINLKDWYVSNCFLISQYFKIIYFSQHLLKFLFVGDHEGHQLHTLNPSQLTTGGGSISDPINSHHVPAYDTTQIPSRTNNTTTQALVNDPTSPTQQQVPITNVIQQNSPSEPDPLYKAKSQKYDKIGKKYD